MTRVKSSLIAVILLVACLTTSMALVQAGFTGDIPAIPIENKSHLLEEEDPFYSTTMKAGILIGQVESGEWLWSENYANLIVKPGGLIDTHPIVVNHLFNDELPVLFGFHAEMIDSENNIKGFAYAYEEGVDPDHNQYKLIELDLTKSKSILIYAFASPATLVGEGSVSFVPEEDVLEASLDINPDTLNLKSNGEWITAYIELPAGYDVNMITEVILGVPTGTDSYTIVYKEDAPSTIGDYDGDGVPDLMVKFDRSIVTTALGAEDVADSTLGNIDEVTLTVSGVVSETVFTGSDIINVKNPGK